MIAFWRYFQSDKNFHAFEVGGVRSLCNAHEASKYRAALGLQDEIPEEILCPFCKALVKQARRLGGENILEVLPVPMR